MTDAVIGRPLPRVDGILKVSGAARYAAEFDQPGQAYAVIISASVGLGKIQAIESGTAEKLPGVIAVISHRNAPRLPYGAHKGPIDPAHGERLHVFQDDEVHFFGQPVAVVIAETLDQAEHAASVIRVRYEARRPELAIEGVALLAAGGGRVAADKARGDADGALATAAVKIDSLYRIARENHNPMEPHATIAAWDGTFLRLWSKSQFVVNEQKEIAAVFGLPIETVQVTCPFVGGGFGTSLRTWPHVTVAAIAARHVGRPVKLVLTRRQMFYTTGHRPRSVQRVGLGAEPGGKLTAIVHEGTGETSRYEDFVEALTTVGTFLYSCPNVRTRYRLAPADTATPTYMRGPGEASGVFALECAMDELAVALKMDPLALRPANEPAIDEGEKQPFSSRSLRECYAQGAALFGWARRDARPRSMRDGRSLIGWGMSAATYPAFQGPASARARLTGNGPAEIETAASDMGPGTYTAMTQVAAEALGLEPDQVSFRLGRSDFSPTPPHGGSMTMASVGSAVQAAALAVRGQAARIASADPRSPLFGADPAEITARDGKLCLVADPARSDSYAALVARNGTIAAEASSARGVVAQGVSMHASGAVFAEVAIDPDLATIRVRRAVGAYAAGRIVNPLLARSQCIGGMVGGIGMALMEQTVLDPRDGRRMNASLADYLVPVNLDIGDLDVVFIPEEDSRVNPLGVKGLGEIALVGMAPAIANAVHHATGRRIRDLPIELEALL
ncbi:MAG TPA: xanthine dehydrogenase family protein molybdopterin-binding subunit [Acetobacteraceae bacterium]|nr:xanthine dehydrogenase family protein molybdopterin-binding subunit [Acetobacteraceae bacterium]